MFHEDLTSGLLLSASIAFGTVLYVVGILHNRFLRISGFGNTYILFSSFILIVALYILSFAGIHEDLEGVLVIDVLAMIPIIISSVIFVTLTLLNMGLLRSDTPLYTSGKLEVISLTTIHLLSYVVLLHPNISEYLYFILFNFVIIGASAVFILLGVSGRRSVMVNIGVSLFALIVVTRYIDLFMGMLPTSLFFIGGGLVLFVGGFILEKSRRKMLNNFDSEGQLK